jgi:hypothetical protein
VNERGNYYGLISIFTTGQLGKAFDAIFLGSRSLIKKPEKTLK